MKVVDLLEKKEETADKTGTYAAVHLDKSTTDAIAKYMKENDIPNPLAAEKMHTTVLYSRKHCPDYEPAGKIDPPWIGTPTHFDVWESRGKDESDKPKRCLVLEYDCPQLDARHEELMEEHGATYDFPDYKTHITLSYDIGDMDIKDLPDIKKMLPEIKIVSEYGEDLDLDWAKNNKAK